MNGREGQLLPGLQSMMTLPTVLHKERGVIHEREKRVTK